MQQFDLGLNLSIKKIRKREFLEQMQQVVPWKDFVALIAPYAPEGRTGRPPFPVEMLLRIHFMHVWTRCLLQAPLEMIQRSAHMYTACLVGNPYHARSLNEIRALRP